MVERLRSVDLDRDLLKRLGLPLAAILVALLYPSYVESLQGLPAIANVIEIVRLTSMPIIAAASLSWATARIAFPCFVDVTNQVRSASTGSVITTIASLFQE